MSDSLRPHGLCSPWNSPGQNTGVGSPSRRPSICSLSSRIEVALIVDTKACMYDAKTGPAPGSSEWPLAFRAPPYHVPPFLTCAMKKQFRCASAEQMISPLPCLQGSLPTPKIILLFVGGTEARGILIPLPGIEPSHWQWKCRVLITREFPQPVSLYCNVASPSPLRNQIWDLSSHHPAWLPCE